MAIAVGDSCKDMWKCRHFVIQCENSLVKCRMFFTTFVISKQRNFFQAFCVRLQVGFGVGPINQKVSPNSAKWVIWGQLKNPLRPLNSHRVVSHFKGLDKKKIKRTGFVFLFLFVNYKNLREGEVRAAWPFLALTLKNTNNISTEIKME